MCPTYIKCVYKRILFIVLYLYRYAFFPFGQGPRGCIGMRFALLETKLAVSNIVRKFNLIPSSKTNEPSQTDPKGAVAYPRLGLYIKAEKRF